MWKKIKGWLKKCKPLVIFMMLYKHASQSSPLVYNCRGWTENNFVRVLLQILVTPYYCVKYFFPPKRSASSGLAFVLIAKNEATYIKEWLDFHIKQGVSHFLIYDNESTDNFREVLRPYIGAGQVTYHFIKGKRRQVDAYNMALHDFTHKRWRTRNKLADIRFKPSRKKTRRRSPQELHEMR